MSALGYERALAGWRRDTKGTGPLLLAESWGRGSSVLAALGGPQLFSTCADSRHPLTSLLPQLRSQGSLNQKSDTVSERRKVIKHRPQVGLEKSHRFKPVVLVSLLGFIVLERKHVVKNMTAVTL